LLLTVGDGFRPLSRSGPILVPTAVAIRPDYRSAAALLLMKENKPNKPNFPLGLLGLSEKGVPKSAIFGPPFAKARGDQGSVR
jgi:hypothetical protein